MVVANFKYNDKEYVYVLNNNQVEYGYIENDVINNNLTEQEKQMMDYIFSKITISNDSKNHIKCGITIYNNKQFQIMYDTISERKFFYEIKNNKYCIPNDDDNLYLINRFNPIILYKDNNKIEHLKTLAIKINCGMIVVFTSLILLNKYEKTPFVYLINSNINSFMDYNSGDYSSDQIKEIVENNNNLSKEEKKFILRYFNIIEENSNHISMKVMQENLSDLNIKYDKFSCKDSEYTKGENNFETKEITIYNSESFNDVIELPYGEQTLLHEIIHSFSRITNLGNGLSEAITETMSSEYTNCSISHSYVNERCCLYALLEIIDVEDMKEFYFKGDATVLVDALNEIIQDREMSYELIGNIDLIYDYEVNLVKNNCDIDSTRQYHELKNNIYNSISKYFSAKYGYDITEDQLMMTYLVNSGFATLKIDSPYIENNNDHGINQKGYFSTDYINLHPTVSYYDSNQNYIEIPNRKNKTK